MSRHKHTHAPLLSLFLLRWCWFTQHFGVNFHAFFFKCSPHQNHQQSTSSPLSYITSQLQFFTPICALWQLHFCDTFPRIVFYLNLFIPLLFFFVSNIEVILNAIRTIWHCDQSRVFRVFSKAHRKNSSGHFQS